MDDTYAFATCPRHVRAIDFGHVLVLIDYRTGRAHSLLPPAGQQWQRASRTGTLHALDDAFARRLFVLGLLAPTREPIPWTPPIHASSVTASWGSTEHPAGISRPPHAAVAATLAGTAALTAAFAATRCGTTSMRQALTLLVTASARTLQPATPAQATAAVHAVRRVAWNWPGRTACLEESVAAFLLLAARRLRVRWCHGVASDPIRLHAWVQTMDSVDVAEPASTRAYTPVLTIGGHHHQLR